MNGYADDHMPRLLGRRPHPQTRHLPPMPNLQRPRLDQPRKDTTMTHVIEQPFYDTPHLSDYLCTECAIIFTAPAGGAECPQCPSEDAIDPSDEIGMEHKPR